MTTDDFLAARSAALALVAAIMLLKKAISWRQSASLTARLSALPPCPHGRVGVERKNCEHCCVELETFFAKDRDTKSGHFTAFVAPDGTLPPPKFEILRDGPMFWRSEQQPIVVDFRKPETTSGLWTSTQDWCCVTHGPHVYQSGLGHCAKCRHPLPCKSCGACQAVRHRCDTCMRFGCKECY